MCAPQTRVIVLILLTVHRRIGVTAEQVAHGETLSVAQRVAEKDSAPTFVDSDLEVVALDTKSAF
jgi:hypothetical protein